MKKASVIVVEKDNKILLINRYNSGKFGLPGGKSELNESPEETAIRECFEETGIIVTKCSFLFSKIVLGEIDFEVHCFFANQFNGEIIPSAEGSVHFMDKEFLVNDKSAFPEYNKIVVEHLNNKLSSSN